MKKSAFVQIFTGGYRGGQAPFSQVRAALEQLPEDMALSGVLMGWAPGKDLYRKTAAYLARRGIPLYLWLPVFSETSLLEPCAPLITMHGESLRSPNATEAENFDFCCPASPQNADNVRRIMERHFLDVDFYGVFLDKIRYPSPANLPWGWQVCFCPDCVAQYRRHGLSPMDIRFLASRLPEADAPFTVLAYEKGVYRFEDSGFELFFKARSDIVTSSVAALSGWFGEKGYRVGLDVFAPFLAPFVGQDIPALSRRCDWVKPMMYQRTYAPAGLPFEVSALCREGSKGGGESWFTAMMGDGRARPDSVFLRGDLKGIGERAACPVYPGLEVNRVQGIADIAPEDVRRAADILPEDTKGVVLSWNLLCAPQDNIRAAYEMLEGR